MQNGDFPSTTMMPAAFDNFLPLDDDWRNIALRTHLHHLLFTQRQE
jgi:hypothetical protein